FTLNWIEHPDFSREGHWFPFLRQGNPVHKASQICGAFILLNWIKHPDYYRQGPLFPLLRQGNSVRIQSKEA
ncbi:hypothetical protein, partial [Sediminibacterium sp. Gen4]|uniref:hypothetical protein n=1 Tax=Sediminibacterium sp. Gen4 TaxID=2736285 RepID=UPI0026360DDD